MATTPGPVYVSAGGQEYRYILVTENTGKNITGDSAVLALLPSPNAPVTGTTGQAPDVTTNPTTSSVQLGMLVTSVVAPGEYRLWAKLTDSPEIPWLPCPEVVTVV